MKSCELEDENDLKFDNLHWNYCDVLHVWLFQHCYHC